MNKILTSSVILVAKTKTPGHYIFGAYKENDKATGFMRLPEDYKMFTEALTGEQTVMGFKTLQATPDDFPDDGRICVTHHPEKVNKGAIPASDIPEGIKIAKERAAERGKDRIYVIGGASIIRQCLEKNLLDEIKLTMVYDHYEEADHFVYLDLKIDEWNIEKDSGILISKHSKPENLKYRFYTLKRK